MLSRVLLSILMCTAGLLHLVKPDIFIRIVPDYLPNAFLLVALSGVFEVAGGVGLLLPPTRRFAAWGLIALYVAVFPANVNMALHPDRFASIPPAALWFRLLLQPALLAWAWAAGLRK